MVYDDLTTGPDDDGPSPAELDAIEDEWPVIAAALELTGIEFSLLDRPVTGWDRQRLRRAAQRLRQAETAYAARRAHDCAMTSPDEIGLTDGGYGCKVLACRCGNTFVSHRATYGCPQGDRHTVYPRTEVA